MPFHSSTSRAALALLLFSGWLTLLFVGWALGGGVHLLLVASLVLFPWRALSGPSYAAEPAGDTTEPQTAGTEDA